MGGREPRAVRGHRSTLARPVFPVGSSRASHLGQLFPHGADAELAAERLDRAHDGTVVVAQALRATAFFHGNAALTFAAVSLVVGGTFVLGWRAIAVFLTAQRRAVPA